MEGLYLRIYNASAPPVSPYARQAQNDQKALQMTQTPIPEVDRTVFIVDDDPAIRESLVSLLRSVGLKVMALASVPDFLNCPRSLMDPLAWCST